LEKRQYKKKIEGEEKPAEGKEICAYTPANLGAEEFLRKNEHKKH